MFTAVVALAAVQQIVRPNIVYIMADDLGYGELGCYGQQKIPTPNIDRLASEGVRFTQFYAASPVCAPTRCSLLTGKHQGHAAVRGNKEQGGFGPNDKEGQFPLPLGETTIASVLKKAGYRTGLVGKWGLGGPAPDETPLTHGFDTFYGQLCQRRAHNHYPPYLWNDFGIDLLMGNHPFDAHQRIAAPLESPEDYDARFSGKDYEPAKLTNACVRFIESSKRRPFFLYYAPTLPHLALQAPRDWINRFPKEWDTKPYLGQNGYLPTDRPRATYAAMIAFLDDSVGEVLKAVEAAGQTQNTLVVFTSDNGASNTGGVDTHFFLSNGVLRAGKMSLYEGGIREPFIASWPGKIPKGSVSDHVAACFDSFATLAEVAGVKSPKSDGISYLGALLGRPNRDHDYLYFEYPEAASQQAIVMGQFKVVKPDLTSHPEKLEVYDLASDPSEAHDIAEDRPDLVARAVAILKKEHVPNTDFPLPGVDKTP